MKTCLKTAAKNDMKIRVIGDIEPLDENIKSRIKELEEATVNNGGFKFTIALNYGSRDEITRAVKKIAEDCREGKINPDSITEKTVNDYLDTHDIPDPDLMIRTSWGAADCPIICSGSLLTQNFILQMCHGRHLRKKS